MLQLQGLAKMFQVVQVQTHALRGVDLHVGEGGGRCGHGPSGSGDSTFLNIAGILRESTAESYQLDCEDVITPL